MFNNNFDPYDMLITLNERLNQLEQAHNNLGRAFQKTERELNTALKSLNHLQRSHLELSQFVAEVALKHKQ